MLISYGCKSPGGPRCPEVIQNTHHIITNNRGAKTMDIRKDMETVVKLLVDKPECVVVTLNKGKTTAILEIEADQDDVGKLIGRQGHMAKTLDSFTKALAGKYKMSIRALEIVDKSKENNATAGKNVSHFSRKAM